MGQLKSLAGQTAVYGVSSILGRLINYALVPLHTSIFYPEQLGIVTALFAYTAILMIVFTFGMETAYFRFSKEKPDEAFNTCFLFIIIISTVLSSGIFLLSNDIAGIIGYPQTSDYISYLAIILWIDAFSSIPFAKLRQENKAKKFASIKVTNILINILFQVVVFLILPQIDGKYENLLSIEYIFIANLLANGITILFLVKEIKSLRFSFDSKLSRRIVKYAFPIFIMGLAGMLNEQLDKILLENWLPDSFYSNYNSTEALGIYGQTFKLGIFMMLAIQAFRFAGEPFFFSKSDDKNAPELFAKVMHYFVILGLLLFVLVSINVDLIALIFLRSAEYRSALYLVPILLIGKLMYGIYINLSIWFKLTDKTYYGTYFSIVGVLITILGNILLIPIYGMLGAAYSIILCYGIMCISCYVVGQKYFPVPYRFAQLIPYGVFAIVVVYAAYHISFESFWLDVTSRIGISILLILALYAFEKKKLVEEKD